MNLVGQNIRKIRNQKGYSQEYMADSLGITQPSYARLEKDDHRINVVRLMQIAQYLDVNVGALLGQKAQNIIHNNKGNNAQAEIGTYMDNQAYINSLKEEIVFLREILRSHNI